MDTLNLEVKTLVKRAPIDWPTRQRIGYSLDKFFEIIKKSVISSAKKRWKDKWREELFTLLNKHFEYKKTNGQRIDLLVCLLFYKIFWPERIVEELIEIRNAWAHQREFTLEECERALKLMDEFHETLL